ncbi:hypothetical protein [Vibrio phage vB_VhaS-tm]|nr:hypothetical protein [Vibrio phage vB_VhaS-tm]
MTDVVQVIAYGGTFWKSVKPDPPKPIPTPYVFAGGYVGVTKSNRVDMINPKADASANAYESVWEEIKNTVFLNPKEVNLGVSADATVRTFEMWHTFLTPLQINDIVQTGTRGMILTREGGNIKDIIPSQGFAKYILNIGLQTDTLIDAKYEWKTTPLVKGVTITVTGSRIVPWPYIPQGGFIESREWLTDVIRTRKREQRLSLRHGPRKTVSHSYMLGDQDLSNMWSHDKVWVNQIYAVPDWTRFMRVGPIAKGVMNLPIDGISLGLTAKGFAFIYENNRTFEVRPIKAVSQDNVEFIDAVTHPYNDATVLVIELQKHQQPISIVRTAMGVSVAQAVWEKLDDTLNASNPFPVYQSCPVITDPILMGGSRASGRFGYDIDRVDSVVGMYSDFQEYDWESQTRSDLRWSCNDRAEFERVRNFLDYCRGKQGEFFVPSWNNDFSLAVDIKQSDGWLGVEFNDATLFFRPFHVMLEYVDGSRSFTKVTGTSRGPDHDTFFIEPALADKPMDDVVRICRLNLMRFDTDRFEFQHRDSGMIDVSAPIVAVPED